MLDIFQKWSYKNRKLIVLFAVVIGFFFRLYNLNYVGFAEDEVNKINAVRSYMHGDFTPNAEHPMLMKELIMLSVFVCDQYNRFIAIPKGWRPISEEVAVRFPNVLFGALTAIALYLLASLFFNWRIGLLASFFWATGINAIFINRIAKEDTLMLFFILLGFYFHRKMKTTPETEPEKKQKFYFLSAGSFGMMLASKYFPHYLGLNFLYFAILRKVNPKECPPDNYNYKNLLKYFVVLTIVFLVINPMILNPHVIHYILGYMHQKTVTHHGYYMLGHLFYNNVDKTPFNGTPWYFYFLYLIVKLPLLVLVAMIIGLIWCIGHWREPGPLLLIFWLVFWLVPYSFFGVKFLRYTLSLMPAVYMLAACGVFVIYNAISKTIEKAVPKFQHATISLGVPLIFLVAPMTALITTNPFYSMFINPIGGGYKNAGYYFPHDEYYDLDLREAIRDTLKYAPSGSFLSGETPAVFHYYLHKFHRDDVGVLNLSQPNFNISKNDIIFLFLQPGRRYFENVEFYQSIWNSKKDILDISVMNKPAIKVFKLCGSEFLQIAQKRKYFASAHN